LRNNFFQGENMKIEQKIAIKEKSIEVQDRRIEQDLIKLKLLHNELRQLIRTQHLSVIKALQDEE
jgi:hypothetical protein